MKTIKLPYNSVIDLTPILKQYSSIVRYSYNRISEGKSEKDIRKLIKDLNNVELINTWLIQCGIREGKAIQTKFKNNKVIFGGRYNLLNLSKNKITKDEFQLKRISPVSIQGESLKQGNRSFKLDIIENNQIIFKLSKHKHIEFKLPNLRNNIKRELYKLQRLNEVKSNECGYTYSIKFDTKNIYISFEEFKDIPIELNMNRCIGIDLNPDTIGIAILEDSNIIYTREFSLKPIFDKILNERLSSSSNRMKYYQNKLKFETFEISKTIATLANKYKCAVVFIEDLKFKSPISNKYNNVGNRKIKNLWKKTLFITNLTKRLNIQNIKIHKINPAYSSFIGNLQYDYTDSINASIEITRRGYEFRIKKNKKGFYPNLLVKHQWKEMATRFTDWNKFYLEVKNLKLKYRVSLENCLHRFNVFEQNSHKSMVLNYVFYD